MVSIFHVLASPGATAVRFLPILADAAIKGVIVFAVAACAVALCRRRSAATRHAIWAGAVAAQLTLPVLSALLPAWRVPLIERLDQRFAAAAPAVMDVPPSEVTIVAPAAIAIGRGVGHGVGLGRFHGPRHSSMYVTPRAIIASAPGDAFTISVRDMAVRQEPRFSVIGTLRSLRNHTPAWWIRGAAILWLIGALGILGRFLAGTFAVSRLARRSERVEDGRWLSLAQRVAIRLGVARPMTLLRSGRFDVPVTWGIVYPVVLLPDDADEWTEERRRYVLVHEMAHVKRVDAFTQIIAQLAIAVFWFDPFVWIAAHRMRVEREHACDDYVLNEGTPASTYASDLLAMVRSLGTRGRTAQPAFAALAMARPGELETRMQAILDPGQDRRSLRSAPALTLALCSLLLLLPLAAFKPFAGRRAMSFASADWVPTRAAVADVEMPEMPEMPEAPEAPEAPEVPEMPDIDVSRIQAAGAELQAKLAGAQAALAGVQARVAVEAAATQASSAITRAIAASSAGEASVATTVGAASTWPGTNASCSSVSLKHNGKSTSVSTSSDDDDKSFQYISSSAGRCVQVAVWGAVEFTPDEREVQRVSRDGRLYVRERRQNADREVEVTPGDNDALRYTYRVDGERAGFDDDARAWLGDLLPEILRESGLNARARVARVRRDGGVPAVLADISRTESTSAKRAAYDALLQEGKLSDDDLSTIARQAGEDLSSSDGELAGVLEQLGKMSRGSSTMAEAFGNAVEHMSSDGEKRELLQQYALKGDREMLCVAGRQAKSISSDGEKSEFLRATVNSYLANDDETLRKMFFDVVGTISSDGERHEVLNSALAYGQRPAVLLAVLESAKDISSDGEKSELLVTILHKKLVTTPALKDVFMKITRTLSSDGEYRRVMEAALTS